MVTSENKDREPQRPLYYEYSYKDSKAKVHRPQPMIWYRPKSSPICSSIPDGGQRGIRYTHPSAFHSVSRGGHTYDRRRFHKMALNFNTEAEEDTQVTWCSTGSNYRCSVAVTSGEGVGDVHLRNRWGTYLEHVSRCGGQDVEEQSEIDVGDYKTDVSSHNASSPACSFRSDGSSTCLSPPDASTRHMTSECVLKTVISLPIKTTNNPVSDVASTESFAQYTNLFAGKSEEFRLGPICISELGIPRSQSPPNRVQTGYNKATSMYEDETVLKNTDIPLSMRLNNDRKCWTQSTIIPSLNNGKHLSGEQLTGSRLSDDDVWVKTGCSLAKRGSCLITEYGQRSHISSPNRSNEQNTRNSPTAASSFNDKSLYRKGPEQNMFNYNPKKNMLIKADSLPAVRVQDSVLQYPTVNTTHGIYFSSTGVNNAITLKRGTEEYITRHNDMERNSPRDTPPSIEYHETIRSASSQSTQSKFISGKSNDNGTFVIRYSETDDKHGLFETNSSPILYSAIRYHTETRRKCPFEETLGSDQQGTSSECKTEIDEGRGASPDKCCHLENGIRTEDEQRMVIRHVLSRKSSHIETNNENISENRPNYPPNSLSVLNRIKIGDHQLLDQGDLPQNISTVGSRNRMGDKHGFKDHSRYIRRRSSMETMVEIDDTELIENDDVCTKRSSPLGNDTQIVKEISPPKQGPSSQRSSPLTHPDSQHVTNNQDVPFPRSTVLLPSGHLEDKGGESASQQVDIIRETELGREFQRPSQFSAEDTVLRSRVLVLLWVLLGESRLRDVGYPKEPVHRILWRAVDVCCSVAGVKSAAAVPLNSDHDCGMDMLCFRDHTHRFLEVCAPTREHWKQFGWAGLTVDAVVRKIYDEGKCLSFSIKFMSKKNSLSYPSDNHTHTLEELQLWEPSIPHIVRNR